MSLLNKYTIIYWLQHFRHLSGSVVLPQWVCGATSGTQWVSSGRSSDCFPSPLLRTGWHTHCNTLLSHRPLLWPGTHTVSHTRLNDYIINISLARQFFPYIQYFCWYSCSSGQKAHYASLLMRSNTSLKRDVFSTPRESVFVITENSEKKYINITSAVVMIALQWLKFSHHKSVLVMCCWSSPCSRSMAPISSFNLLTICKNTQQTDFNQQVNHSYMKKWH